MAPRRVEEIPDREFIRNALLDYARRVEKLDAGQNGPIMRDAERALALAGHLDPAGAKPRLELAEDQIGDAMASGRVDTSAAPEWTWPALAEMMGPMVPGDLNVVGAITGNGKTAFMLSQLNAFAVLGVPTLYVPLEIDPPMLRRQWAAWALGLPWDAVAYNRWHEMAPGAQQAHEREMARQGLLPVAFPPDRRVSVADLGHWVGWAVREIGARVVIVDHFHRMDHGSARDYRVQVSEAARHLKDLARQHAVALVATAQLNRHGAMQELDRYCRPTLDRLKESSAIAEESNTVLMLSRGLKPGYAGDAKVLRQLKTGELQEHEIAEPGAMLVTCRKHRLRGDKALDRTVKLRVVDGRVLSC